MTALPSGTTKLVQYLNEAYGTERRLEVALQAHLGLASRRTYKNRLRDHLAETKRHGREVSRRIKQLGGTPETIDIPGPEALGEVAQRAVAGAQRAVALAQGPMHALRGTGEEEKQLKNAKTEYASEAEEIATYRAIVTVADALGDQETAKLARAILREEERMLSFLEKEIPRMAAAVVVAEVPRGQRATKRKARKRSAKARSSSSRASTSRASRSSRSTSKRAGSRSTASKRAGSRSTASKRAASRAGGSKRSTARRSASKRSAAGASKRSTARTTSPKASSGAKRSGARTGGSRRSSAASKGGTSTTARRSSSNARRSSPNARRSASNARRGSTGAGVRPVAVPATPALVIAR